jgi:membrane protein implicated in regulation of membrane protease activity
VLRVIEILGRINRAFWATCLGVIVLFVFFAAIGGFSPADVAWLTALVVVMTVAFAIHAYRLRRQILTARGGLSKEQQRMRERRGF